MARGGIGASIRFAGVAAVLTGLARIAGAADYYVDGSLGSNANDGTTPASAWRNVSWAVAQVPSPGAGTTHVIHVAPGTYSPAQGETLPFTLRANVELVGDAGSADTVIDASGSSLVARVEYQATGSMSGFTLRDGSQAFSVGGYFGSAGLRLRDMRILQMGSWAVNAFAEGNNRWLRIELADVRIARCGGGLFLSSNCNWGTSLLTAVDTQIVYSGSYGVFFSSVGHDESSTLGLTRCLVADGRSDGVLTEAPDGCCLYANFSDTTIARNSGDGFTGSPAMAQGANFTRCTVAHNGGAGIRAESSLSVHIAASIVYGNGDDLVVAPNRLTGSYSDVGDGDLTGSTVISADPLFRDAGRCDFRLTWGSPCIDTVPGVSAGTPDRNGLLRPIDGNLDALELADMGAQEFAPLSASDAAHVGGVVSLELQGPDFASSALYAANGALLVPPIATPFGELDLNPASRIFVLRLRASSAPGNIVTFPLPFSASAIGRTFAFQALVSSYAAPALAAWTNPIVITLAP